MPGREKQLNLHREVALSIKDLLLSLNHWYSQPAKACCYIRSLLFNELCLPALFSSWQGLCPYCVRQTASTALDHICGAILTGCGSFVVKEMNQNKKGMLKYYNLKQQRKRKRDDRDSLCICARQQYGKETLRPITASYIYNMSHLNRIYFYLPSKFLL